MVGVHPRRPGAPDVLAGAIIRLHGTARVARRPRVPRRHICHISTTVPRSPLPSNVSSTPLAIDPRPGRSLRLWRVRRLAATTTGAACTPSVSCRPGVHGATAWLLQPHGSASPGPVSARPCVAGPEPSSGRGVLLRRRARRNPRPEIARCPSLGVLRDAPSLDAAPAPRIVAQGLRRRSAIAVRRGRRATAAVSRRRGCRDSAHQSGVPGARLPGRATCGSTVDVRIDADGDLRTV